MTPHPSITVQQATAQQATQAVDELALVLTDCVQGGASVGSMWPLPWQRAQAFWGGVADAVAQQRRLLLLARDHGGRVVGTVQLVLDMPDNQPHRADVAKMLVHRSARRHGVAAQLLAAVEAASRAEGRSVLVLDTAQTEAATAGKRCHGRSHELGGLPDQGVVEFRYMGLDQNTT